MTQDQGPLKVCIVARKDLSRNTRIIRQARSLSARGHAVTVLALGLPMAETRETATEVRYVEVASAPLSSRLTGLTRLLKGRTWKRLLLDRPARAVRRVWRVALAVLAKLTGTTRPKHTAPPQPARAEPKAPRREVRQRKRGGLAAGLYLQARDAAFAHDAGRLLAGMTFDVLQIHDAHALRVATRHGQAVPPALIYDAVEIPEDRSGWAAQGVPRFLRWIEGRLTGTLVRRMDAVLTVSDGLRDWTARRYGIPAPSVVRNCRHFQEVSRPDAIRRDCRLEPGDRLALYLNSLYGGQGLEQLADSLDHLPPHIHVATLGPVAQPGFVEALRRRTEELGVAARFHLLEPKPPTAMLDYASGADIGVIPRQNTSLNNFHSLPNRVFELIMARLPIAGPSLRDMQDFIESNGLGRIFDETDPADIAGTIQAMLEPETLATLRARIEAAAREFSWDREGERYVDLVEATARRIAERRSPTGARAYAIGASATTP